MVLNGMVVPGLDDFAGVVYQPFTINNSLLKDDFAGAFQ